MQRGPRLAAALLAIATAGALAWWLLLRGGPAAEPREEPPREAAAAARPDAHASAPPSAPPAAAAIAPTHRIAEGGRISLAVADLPRDGALALALDLPDVARGSEPRPVRIVSQDGSRELELLAAPLPGSGSGVSLALDPVWLRPDRYLIEVKTAEATHFPLRRYVLEVR